MNNQHYRDLKSIKFDLTLHNRNPKLLSNSENQTLLKYYRNACVVTNHKKYQDYEQTNQCGCLQLSPIPRAFSLQHNNIPEIFLVLVSQLLKISSRMFHTIKTLKSQTISSMISAMCDFLFLSLSSTVQHCKIFTNERG